MQSTTAAANQVTIGARLRTLRRWRGMTQEQLGGLAGITPSYISMWEKGSRLLDRRTHITALARALQVSEPDLTGGPHLSADPVQADPHRAIPPLRVALAVNSIGSAVVEHARPAGVLHDEVTGRIETLRRTSDLAAAGVLLPDVMDELHWHLAHPADEAAYAIAAGALTEAGVIAAAVAKELGYIDLAFLAAQRAEEAAAAVADPVLKGKADFMFLMTLPRTAWEKNLTAAENAAAALEPHARDPHSLQVLGMLALSSAYSAAVVQKAGTVEHWLDAAAEIAGRVPDTPTANWQSFSATNVGIWRMSIAVERGEAGAAVQGLADRVDLSLLEPSSSRRAGFFLDLGRGLAREARTRDRAVRALRQAELAAPQRIRNSLPALETVTYLLNTSVREAGGRELRGMAERMGVLR